MKTEIHREKKNAKIQFTTRTNIFPKPIHLHTCRLLGVGYRLGIYVIMYWLTWPRKLKGKIQVWIMEFTKWYILWETILNLYLYGAKRKSIRYENAESRMNHIQEFINTAFLAKTQTHNWNKSCIRWPALPQARIDSIRFVAH